MTQWLEQSFFFDWNDPLEPTPIPITAQCETLQIKWGRQAATGPDPVAPYFLQIYTSNYVFPFQVDAGSGLSTNFTVPFAPGTQYQICMFDSAGNTGGCQATYTVYAPFADQSQEGKCANFSFPATSLDVSSSVGQYGWVPSCSDITLRPKSGTPPYDISIAPALHPPYNISKVGTEGASWTVDLQWGTPFFVSMMDSGGLSWSYGPLHAGQGEVGCLGEPQRITTGILAGSIVGSTIVGFVIMFLIAYGLGCFRRLVDQSTYAGGLSPIRVGRGGGDQHQPRPFIDGRESEIGQPLMQQPSQSTYFEQQMNYSARRNSINQSGRSPRTTIGSPQLPSIGYQIEPFDPSTVRSVDAVQSPPSTLSPSTRSSSQQVYVVHHDRGPAPVSIYASEGSHVVELPPVYSGTSSYPPGPSHSRRSSSDQSTGTPPRPLPTPTIELIPPAGAGRVVMGPSGLMKVPSAS